MLRRLEALGYYVDGGAEITPRGYKHPQLFHRIDFYGPGARLTPAELREKLGGDITLLFGRSQYAPEQSRIYASNKIYPGGVF